MTPFVPETDQIFSLLVAAGALLLYYRASSPDPEETSPDTAQSLPTVLVVDDDAIPSHTMKRTLEKAGFNVLMAGNGAKGLDLIRYADSVKVVLLDCHMPKLDGAETMGHIRKYFKNVKVIGITGLEPSKIPDAYRNEVDMLLLKPVKSSELLETVCSVAGVKVKKQKLAVNCSTNWVKFGFLYACLVVASLGFTGVLRGVTIKLLALR